MKGGKKAPNDPNALGAPSCCETRGRRSHIAILAFLVCCVACVVLFESGHLSTNDASKLSSAMTTTVAAKWDDSSNADEGGIVTTIATMNGHQEQPYNPDNSSPESLLWRLISELRLLDAELERTTANKTAMEDIQNGTDPYLPFVGKKISNFYIINDDDDEGDDDNPNINNGQPEDEIVVVSHISTNKMAQLSATIRWWSGPISVAVLLTNMDEINQLVQFWTKLRSTDATNHIQPTQKLIFHIYLEARPILDSGRRKEIPYPHNILRNQAFDYFYLKSNSTKSSTRQIQKTQFFVAMDIDLLTCSHCHAELRLLVKDHLPHNNAHKTTTGSKKLTTNSIRCELIYNKRMMVLPAFGQKELDEEKPQAELEAMLPVTQSEVRKQYQQTQQIEIFRASFRRGHGATDFDRWMKWDENRYNCTADAIHLDPTRSDLWYPIEFEKDFEPYIVGYVPPLPHVDRGNAVSNYILPRYFEAFRGYGWNKASWILELHRAGFKFGTLQTTWAVHLYHPRAKNKQQFWYNVKMAKIFLKYLDATYGEQL